MSTILDTERTRYTEVWTSIAAYGDHAPGAVRLPLFLDLVHDTDGTVLDAGTGSGKGALALAAVGFEVHLCDVTAEGLVPEARALPFTEACLWHDLRPLARGVGHPGRNTFDYTYCCDVLEHLPPQFTMLAIDQLLRITQRALFLSIALVPDAFGVWVGGPLHQTVMPFVWWRDALREVGLVADARDLQSDAVFFVRPR